MRRVGIQLLLDELPGGRDQQEWDLELVVGCGTVSAAYRKPFARLEAVKVVAVADTDFSRGQASGHGKTGPLTGGSRSGATLSTVAGRRHGLRSSVLTIYAPSGTPPRRSGP